MRWIGKFLIIIFFAVSIAFVVNLMPDFNLALRSFGLNYERVKDFPSAWDNQPCPADEEKVEATKGEVNFDRTADEQTKSNEGKTGDEEASQENNEEKKYFLTLDEILSIKDISLKDKLAGLSVIKKLKREDIERIVEMAQGGITQEEYRAIENILRNNLEKKDIACLGEILDRNMKNK
ncbi:MAG: hypothetical protein N2489_09840 [Clostridia bacterium]|nr:hypothetical protein [Clostridia bacterium]